MPKPLTIRRLQWLHRQDPVTAYKWLFVNHWAIPSDPDGLRLTSKVLWKIERKFSPSLRTISRPDTGMSREAMRPTLLNSGMRQKICKLLSQGHTIATVCDAVGIGERTYFDWRARFPQFAQATTRAIGSSKVVLHNKLLRCKDWRAAAFLLSRRFPQEYGRVERRVEQPDENKNIGVNIWYDRQGHGLARLLDFPNFETDSPEVGRQKQARLVGNTLRAPPQEATADAPPPKVVPKALTGEIPQNRKGKGK
jgi:hypothetical protein